MNCAPAICAPIRATRRRSSARLRMPAGWSAPSTSRALSISSRRSARIRARPSPDARAVSICVRPARSRLNGNAVAIDANVCAGCGSCASVCPTGAASYALPSADALMRRLRTLLQTYRKAGGSDAVVLFHDGEHGEEIIDALARFGDGLPANVLPLRVNEMTQLGPELLAVRLCLWRQRRRAADARKTPPRHHGTPPRGRNRGSRRQRAGFRHRHHPDHRDRRSGPVARHAGCRASWRRHAKAGRLCAARRETRRARDDFSRASSRRPRAGRCRTAGAGRAVRHREAGCRRLHAVPCLRHRLPDRRAVRQSRPRDAALHREPLRAMRALRIHLPRKSHQPSSRVSTSRPGTRRSAC